MTLKIAVPSVQPGGLDAAVAQHFGHCDLYTLIEADETTKTVTSVTTVPSCAHEHGGCLAPVAYLADKGVNVLLSGGMGMRPLLGFLQSGVAVYYAAGAETVGKAVEAHLAGALPAFSPNHSCGAHH